MIKSTISLAYINITYSNLAKWLSFLQYFLFIIKSLMYIIYDKTSTENGGVIIIELKGKKCEGILIFGTGFHVLKKKKEMIPHSNK